MKGAGLFDPLSATMTRYLPLPSGDCLIAAGGRRLVALDRSTQALTIWDLADPNAEPERKQLDLAGYRVLQLAMGRYVPDFAAAMLLDEQGQATLCTIDLNTGRAHIIRGVQHDTRHAKLQLNLKASPWFEAVRYHAASSHRFALIDGRRLQFRHALKEDQLAAFMEDEESRSFAGLHAPGFNPRHASRYRDGEIIPVVGSERVLGRSGKSRDFRLTSVALFDEELKATEAFAFDHPLDADFIENNQQPPIYAHAALKRIVITPDEDRVYVIPFVLPTRVSP